MTSGEGAVEPAAGALRLGRRNAAVLALCQALYTCAIAVDLTLTGLVGYSLAADKALATLPFSLITIAAAATTAFASLLMQRIGAKASFMLGALAGALGGAISVVAILHQSFALFCAGTAMVGIFQAFSRYYRLAAADGVGPAEKSRAIAIVLTGGVAAAVLGPAIAAGSKSLLAPTLFAGSYLVVSLFGLLSVLVLALFLRDPPAAPALAPQPEAAEPAAVAAPARPLGTIIRQPIFLAALANNVVGYAVMMFVMTATPLAALACHHSIDDSAGIIQWHLVGMFAPSFFAGYLIRRLGMIPVLVTGTLLAALCGAIALASTALPAFYVALLALGVGWNFLYVGGSTLLAQSYRPAERGKTQAACEFTTFAASALASLAAGQMLNRQGWAAVNIAILPLLAVALAVTIWWAVRNRQTALAQAMGMS